MVGGLGARGSGEPVNRMNGDGCIGCRERRGRVVWGRRKEGDGWRWVVIHANFAATKFEDMLFIIILCFSCPQNISANNDVRVTPMRNVENEDEDVEFNTVR